MGRVPFEFQNSGKCCSCGQKKPLDMMSRKNPDQKDLYECTDCKVDQECQDLEKITIELEREHINTGILHEQPNKKITERLMTWVFG